MGTTCSCIAGLVELLTPPVDHDEEREMFHKTLDFIREVPLFRRQLPPSELPKVAEYMHKSRHRWHPGQKLVQQGEMGCALYLVQSGEALIVTGEDSPEGARVRTKILAGDYFGGHTLVTERPNVASVIAGDCGLVTLSMSRKAFEDSGLKKHLRFPKRPAIYEDSPQSVASSMPIKTKSTMSNMNLADMETKSPEEDEFIRNAIRKNVNLRALLETSEDMLCGIVTAAERRIVPKGEIVTKCGQLGQEFFIVREGSFYMDFQARIAGGSAEAALARSTMAERMMRKQDFVQKMMRQSTQKKLENASRSSRRRMSLFGGRSNQQDSMFSRELKPRRSTIMRAGSKGFGSLIDKRWSDKSEQSPKSRRASAKVPRRDLLEEDALVRANSQSEVSPRTPRQMQRLGDWRRNYSEAQGKEEEDIGDKFLSDVLEAGDSFGELSLLYNTPREATIASRENSVAYVVKRKDFKALVSRKGKRFEEYCKLLEEVHALEPLLSPERWELACNATGMVTFRPNERVLTQGKVREAKQWYVVFSGSCTLSQNEEIKGPHGRTFARRNILGTLRRGGHFGERSLLRGDACSQVNCDAGPEGMVCLTFDGECIRVLLESIFRSNNSLLPSVECDIRLWCESKARNWNSLDTDTWKRQVSHDKAQDLEMSSLRKVCNLGRGAFGRVDLVEDFTTKKRYALKQLSKGHVQKQGAGLQVKWEREILSMLESNFVVSLYRTYQDNQHVYFLLEAALGGTLLEALNDHPHVFNEDSPRGSTTAFYMACITMALDHMHERRIAHRDLKPENVMLDTRGYAKLCDMGFARFVLGKTNTRAGTPEYMAPEMIDFPHAHDHSVDWWALGVLSYELLTGHPPFQDDGSDDQMVRLYEIRRSQEEDRLEPFPRSFPHAFKAFVKVLLRKIPRRLGHIGGAHAVQNHLVFSSLGVNFDALKALTYPSPVERPWREPALPHFMFDEGSASENSDNEDDENSLFQRYESEGDGCEWAGDF